MRFAFIRAEKDFFPIAKLCRVLGVTRQGYYAYERRRPSKRVKADDALNRSVRAVFDESRQTYGSPRVLEELRKRRIPASKRRVERAMRAMQLTPPHKQRRYATTVVDKMSPVAPNTLDRDFTAIAPNRRWVTDITYVWTDEGWAYVSVLLDLFSRKVVGWWLDATLSVELPLHALDRALRARCPEKGLLHHSDRGSQYTSVAYRETLAEHGIDVSMSRKGNCWDNAVAESFFATLKRELVDRQRWSSRLELRVALVDYIDGFYNRKRLHSSLGYKTPADIERAAQAA